jgi:hypothetical protein
MCGIWMEDFLENSGKNIIKIMKGKFDLFFPKMFTNFDQFFGGQILLKRGHGRSNTNSDSKEISESQKFDGHKNISGRRKLYPFLQISIFDQIIRPIKENM